MPLVPTYEPRVREQALEGGFQRAPDVGRDLAQAGEAMMRVADVVDRIDLRDAQAKAFDAEAKITSEWLQWDGQARQKYRGQNVDGYAKAAEEWWKKAAETYGKELDPRARTLVNKSLAEKRLQAINSVGTFVNAEKERHADETYAADVVTTIQFGVTTGEVASTAQQIREKAAVLGARKGWTTEQVQAEVLKNLSNLHLAHVIKLAEEKPNDAQAYYDANKAEISFEHQHRIEKVIKGEVDNRFASQFAASVANKPLGEQLAEAAAKIEDPELREKTLTQIRNNYALVKQAREEGEAAAASQAWQLFAQGKRIPEAILAQMSGRERVQLQETMRARAERLAAGRAVKTDMATYIDLRERLAAGERVDLRAYMEKISPSDMEKLIDIQTATKKGGVEWDRVLTREERKDKALRAAGIDKKRDPDAAYNLHLEIERRLNAAIAAKGKPLTPEEEDKVYDSVVMDKVYVDEWGTDPQKPVSMLTPEEMQGAYVKIDGKKVQVRSVPESDRRKIIAALKATGQAVTEQNIVALYLQGRKAK